MFNENISKPVKQNKNKKNSGEHRIMPAAGERRILV
jgi:hypothetical protein